MFRRRGINDRRDDFGPHGTIQLKFKPQAPLDLLDTKLLGPEIDDPVLEGVKFRFSQLIAKS
jgi:hypothetical protein